MIPDVTINKVYLELTQKCNLNCISCFRNNWKFDQTDLSDAMIDKIIDELLTLPHLKEVVLGGIGEPTTHPKFAYVVNRLRGIKLTITTNAFVWTDETIDLLAQNFEKVIVSVDGMPNTFEIIRNFEFERLKKNILNLQNRKKELKLDRPFLVAQLVLSTYNVEDVTPLIPILNKMGFMKLTLSNLLPQKDEDKDIIVYTLHDNKKMKLKRQEWLNKSMQNQLQIKFSNIELKTERKCVFVEDGTMTITADGNVAACYRFAHPSIEYVFGRRKTVYPFYYGNVAENTLQEIWDKPLYIDLREQNISNRFPSCPDCDLVDACDYINDSQCDCKGQYPSCADCLWTRGFIECG